MSTATCGGGNGGERCSDSGFKNHKTADRPASTSRPFPSLTFQHMHIMSYLHIHPPMHSSLLYTQHTAPTNASSQKNPKTQNGVSVPLTHLTR